MQEEVGRCFHAEYNGYFEGSGTEKQFSLQKVKEHGDLILGGLVHKFDQANRLFGKPVS